MISVDNLNRSFPKYPITVQNNGWVYGVWYCGTGWNKVKLHGQYPQTFLKRALALFPNVKNISHCPSGTVIGPGITIDLIADENRCPQIIASADQLPFRDNSFDLILSDPPYSEEDSKIYGCSKYPLGEFMEEARRVLIPGGHLGILHLYYPSYRRKEWSLDALIMVVTGFMRKVRVFSILTKLGVQGELYDLRSLR